MARRSLEDALQRPARRIMIMLMAQVVVGSRSGRAHVFGRTVPFLLLYRLFA
ncbi:MAG: hypothetical protein ACLTTU_12320 [Bilophila wadsworthia]